MNVNKLQLRPAGKGFVLASTGDGLPSMRRLVDAFTGKDDKRYIKLNGEIVEVQSSHMFMSGN